MSDAALTTRPLPTGSVGQLGLGWTGVMTAITTEAALFVFLLFSYYYMMVHLGREMMPEKMPELKLALPNTVILLISSGTAQFAESSIKKNRKALAAILMGITAVLAAVFLAIQLKEWKAKDYGLQTNAYSSFYFTITGFHMAHVAVGWLGWLVVLAWTLLGYFGGRRTLPVSVVALYWHFVDFVWLFIFFTFYIVPRIW